MFGALPDKVFTDRRLSHADVRVLLMVAAHANKANKAWPAAVTIAEALGMSRTTVMNALKRGVRLGYLSKRDRHAKGLKVACEYTLLFDRFDGQSTSLFNHSTSMSNENTSMTSESATLSNESTQTYQGTNQGTDQGTLGLVAGAPGDEGAAPKKKRKPTLAQKPPTLEEVTPYAHELGFTDAVLVEWFNYWTSVGWRSKKTAYRDWKAMLRTRKAQLQGWGKWQERRHSPPPQQAKRKQIWDCETKEEWLALKEAEQPNAPEYTRHAWERHWQAHINDPNNGRTT